MDDFACYVKPDNTYIWTNKPLPNYILVPEIKSAAEMIHAKPDSAAAIRMNSNPTPTPSPTPTPTPTPSPTPSNDRPEPQTTLTRFYSINETDDHETIMDRETHYRIEHFKETGDYIAFNEEGKEVCHIYGDGTTSFSTDGFAPIVSNEKMTLNDIPTGPIVIKSRDNGNEYVINGRRVLQRTYRKADGYYEKSYYDENGNEKKVTSDGHILYYERPSKEVPSKEVKHIYPDGTISYKTESDHNFVTDTDGKYRFYKGTKLESGKYEIDEEGNFICYSDDGSVTKRNSKGHLLETTDINSYTYYHDYKNGAKVATRDGKTTYSKINHIEYDEEAYDEVLEALNGIDGSSINTACSNIESELSKLPDACTSDVNGVKNNINGHINLISSLSSMTNYSLLAYQTCDDSLKENLNALIDSLFGDTDKKMGNYFKNLVKSSVENKDGILSYNKDTDFKRLNIVTTLLSQNHYITVLEGDEYSNLLKELNIPDSESLLIVKEPTDFNGVTMDVYRTIDVDNIDLENFEKYVAGSNDMIRNVDKEVLKYTNGFGTHFVYCGSYSAAPDLYNGHFAGISYPESKATLAVYMGEWYVDDTDAILHELGHTFDHCIYNDQTGNYGSTTRAGFEYYDKLPDSINTRE